MTQYVLMDRYILILILIIAIACGVLYICHQKTKIKETLDTLHYKPPSNPTPKTVSFQQPIQQVSIQEPPLQSGPLPKPSPPPLPVSFVGPNKGPGSLLCPASTIIVIER